jgi:hypothetical protein
MTFMTEVQARRDLKAWREKNRWSFETLFADMRAVLGRTSLSIPTLRRLESQNRKSHPYTLADIEEYLKKTAKKRAA